MRIAICIIYVHDDVDVSAYEYVNDNDMYIDIYVCTGWKMKNDF